MLFTMACKASANEYASNDGKYVAYAITSQEGDATLVVQASDHRIKKRFRGDRMLRSRKTAGI
jgi:mannose-1-phosphate guanylyltransferase